MVYLGCVCVCVCDCVCVSVQETDTNRKIVNIKQCFISAINNNVMHVLSVIKLRCHILFSHAFSTSQFICNDLTLTYKPKIKMKRSEEKRTQKRDVATHLYSQFQTNKNYFDFFSLVRNNCSLLDYYRTNVCRIHTTK